MKKGEKIQRGVCVCELLIGVQHWGKQDEKPPNQPCSRFKFYDDERGVCYLLNGLR